MPGEELTAEQRKELEEAFNAFDRDKSGAIDTKELKSVMLQLGFNPSDDELQRMINEVDDNQNGEIEFEEFLAMMTARLVLRPSDA